VVASDKIHRATLSKVIYSTIDFIWSNQVGQVANRFSRDMNEVDLILPGTMKNFIYQVKIRQKTLLSLLFSREKKTKKAVWRRRRRGRRNGRKKRVCRRPLMGRLKGAFFCGVFAVQQTFCRRGLRHCCTTM
jgi:hypothetical protein